MKNRLGFGLGRARQRLVGAQGVSPSAPTNVFLSAEDFDEDMPLGDIATISANGSPASTFSFVGSPGPFGISGSTLTLLSPLDWETDPSHTITIRADNGEGSPHDKEFTIIVNDVAEDFDPPVIVARTPANNATDVSRTTRIILEMNEDVQLSTEELFAYLRENDFGWQTWKLYTTLNSGTGDGQISVSGRFVEFHYDGLLEAGESFAVRIDNGAIEDLAGNPFGGISTDSAWTWTVAAADTQDPTMSLPSGVATGSSTADWGGTTDEAGGTIFAAARLATDLELSKINIEAGTGNAVATDTDTTPTADANNGGSFAGLDQSETYVVDMFHRDAAGNESDVVSSASFTTSAASTVTSIDFDNNFTVPLGSSASAGLYEGGMMAWVLNANSIASDPSPARTQDGGEDINGAQINPIGKTAPIMFTERGSGASSWYTGTPVSYPAALSVGDIYVKGRDDLTYNLGENNAWRNGLVDDYCAVVIVDTPPPANSLPPAVMGWSGRGTPQSRVHSIDTIFPTLTRYQVTNTAEIPPLEELMEHFEKFHFGGAIINNTSGYGYESMSPSFSGRDKTTNNASNYGQYQMYTQAAAAMMLMLDSTHISDANWRRIAVHLAMVGMQHAETWENGGNGPYTDGGHWQWHAFSICWYYAVTNQLTKLETFVSALGGALQNPFEITAGNIADLTQPHDDIFKCCATRRRTITAVSGNNVQVSSDYDGVIGGVPRADSFRMQFVNAYLVRESDGARAKVLVNVEDEADGSEGPLEFTLASNPFSVSDTVYFQPAYLLIIGNVDWANRADNLAWFVPTSDADYRPTNLFTPHAMFFAWLRNNFTFDASELDPTIRYGQLMGKGSYPPNDGWPNGAGAWNGYDFTRVFFDEHGDTIIGATDATQPSILNLVLDNETEDGFDISFDVSAPDGTAYLYIDEVAASDEVEISIEGTRIPITGSSYSDTITGLTPGTLYNVALIYANSDFYYDPTPTTATVTTSSGAGDVTGPELLASTPADEDGNVALSAPTIVLVFDEDVQEGTSGNFTVRKDSGGFANEEVFDVTAEQGTSPGQMNIVDNTVTLYLTNDYDASTSYALQADPGSIRDMAASPNDWAGIPDDTTLNWTTAAAGGGEGLPVTDGLVLHLESDLGVTLRDGDTHLDAWVDQSPEGNTPNVINDWDLVTTPTGEMAFETGGFTGGAALDLAAPSGFPTGNAARTMIMVCRVVDDNNTFAGFHYGNNATGEAWGLIVGGSSGHMEVDYWGSADDSGVDANLQGWMVWGARYDGAGNLDHRQNDVQIDSATGLTLTTADPATNDGYVINKGLASSAKLSIEIAAVLMYDRELTSAEYTQVSNYLDAKFRTV